MRAGAVLLNSGSPALTSAPSYRAHEACQALVISSPKKTNSRWSRCCAGGVNALQQHSWEGVSDPIQVPRVFPIVGHRSHRLECHRDIARISPAREWCLTDDGTVFHGRAA